MRCTLEGVAGRDCKISDGSENVPAAIGAMHKASAAELAASLLASISITATSVAGFPPVHVTVSPLARVSVVSEDRFVH